MPDKNLSNLFWISLTLVLSGGAFVGMATGSVCWSCATVVLGVLLSYWFCYLITTLCNITRTKA